MLAPTAPAASSARAVTPNVKTNAAIVAPFAAQASSVGVNGYFSVDPAQQGGTFQAAIVFDIPEGMHVNSNRPLGKYAIATSVKVEPPRGLRVTPVAYPAGKVRSFKFGDGSPEEKLAVYEGRAVARFSIGEGCGAGASLFSFDCLPLCRAAAGEASASETSAKRIAQAAHANGAGYFVGVIFIARRLQQRE